MERAFIVFIFVHFSLHDLHNNSNNIQSGNGLNIQVQNAMMLTKLSSTSDPLAINTRRTPAVMVSLTTEKHHEIYMYIHVYIYSAITV